MGGSSLCPPVNSKIFLPKSKHNLIEIVDKPGWLDEYLFVEVALNFGSIHVWGVLEILGEATVPEDDGVEDLLDHHVGVLATSVDVAVLVIELNGTGNGLEK